MVLKNSHKYRTSNSTSSDTETNWEEINSSLGVASPVYSIDLNDPEDDPGDKINTRCETQQENGGEHFPVLDQRYWEHRIWGTKTFPDNKKQYKKKSDCQRCNNMGRVPGICLASPVEAD